MTFELLNWINAGAVSVLVIVTGLYALSTHRMSKELREQGKTLKMQSELLRDQAELSARHAKLLLEVQFAAAKGSGFTAVGKSIEEFGQLVDRRWPRSVENG